jgi:PGF-CTERM protein/surface glycoprotein (TIGR04207 family)
MQCSAIAVRKQTMTDNNSKLRAVLLAALMVLWVFAGTMAFAGSAAAASDPANVDMGGTPANIAESTSDQSQSVTGTTISKAGGFSGSNAKAYVNITTLAENGVDLSSLGVTVDSTTAGGSSTNILQNNDLTVVEITLTGVQGDATVDVDYTLTGLGTDGAGPANDITYDVAASDGSDTAARFDPNSGNAPDADDTPSDTFSINSNAADPADLPDYADATWASQETRYQGQELAFLPSQNQIQNQNEFGLHPVDFEAAQPIRSEIRALSVRDDRTVRIRTSSLEGEYVIIEDGDRQNGVIVTKKNGEFKTRASSGDAADKADDALVNINTQNLDTDFVEDDGDVDTNVQVKGNTSLEFLSNRDDYDIDVSSQDTSESELLGLLRSASNSDGLNIGLDDDDEVVVKNVPADFVLNNITFDDAGLEEGNYSFTFDSQDTDVSDTSNITVGEEVDADATFEDDIIQQNRGDIVNVSLTTEELDDGEPVEIVIGDVEDAGVEARFTAEPNDDDELIFQVNTFAFARSADDYSNTSSGTQAPAAVGIGTSEGSINGDVNVTTESGNKLGRILDAGLYDVVAREDPAGTNDQEEYDVAAIELFERNTGDIVMHSAPNNDFSELDDRSELYEIMNESRIVENDVLAIQDSDRSAQTRDDVAVHAVDISGIYGAGIAGESDFDDGQAIAENLFQNGILRLTIEQEDVPLNQDESAVNLNSGSSTDDIDDFHYVADNDNNTLFISVPVGEISGVETGDEYKTSLNVTDSHLDNFRVQSEKTSTVPHEDDEETTGNFSVVDREATFDTVDEEVRVNPAEEQTISGTTTVAPGTEIRVRARALSSEDESATPFLKTNTTRVNEDGTFEGVLDFSDAETGQNFTATIPGQSFEDDAETDGRVVEGDISEVEITNQTTDGTTATVDRVYLPEGGFVTIHDGSLLDGATFDSVRGTSEYLESGEHEDVEVTLDSEFTENESNSTIIAMPHQDTNDNEAYDFVTSEGDDDGPYANAEGDAVTDSATLTVQEEVAEVSISDQTATGQADSLTVDSAFLPEGGFVTIHDGSLLDGDTLESVRGTSSYLEAGNNSDVEVSLDEPYTEDGTAVAMPHQDTNDNEAYDFVSSEGSDDGPYTNANGDIVLDDASVTIEAESTPTATAEPTETATATESEDQPGFGAVIALIALLGAALLAARRNAF